MISGKEFNRLVYLIEEINIPLEFTVLEHIGKELAVSRWNLFGDDKIEKIKKNNVSYENMAHLIDICCQRTKQNLKNVSVYRSILKSLTKLMNLMYPMNNLC